jgi:hypothetical protein
VGVLVTLVGTLRWVVIAGYSLLGWTLGHDGDTPGEFVVMVVIGVSVLWYLVLADWILHGRPPIDREQP